MVVGNEDPALRHWPGPNADGKGLGLPEVAEVVVREAVLRLPIALQVSHGDELVIFRIPPLPVERGGEECIDGWDATPLILEFASDRVCQMKPAREGQTQMRFPADTREVANDMGVQDDLPGGQQDQRSLSWSLTGIPHNRPTRVFQRQPAQRCPTRNRKPHLIALIVTYAHLALPRPIVYLSSRPVITAFMGGRSSLSGVRRRWLPERWARRQSPGSPNGQTHRGRTLFTLIVPGPTFGRCPNGGPRQRAPRIPRPLIRTANPRSASAARVQRRARSK